MERKDHGKSHMTSDTSLTPRKLMCRSLHFLHRIAPRSRDARPNPEEPVDEDEDVQAERIRTATALTTSIEEVGKQVTRWMLVELFQNCPNRGRYAEFGFESLDLGAFI